MREIIADARNIYHQVTADKVHTTIEAVLTVRNRKLEFIGGSLGQIDELETIRFGMTIEAAETLADHIMKWVATAQEEQERLEQLVEAKS